ncbi:unnamed protein product [Didymodactylos carnosus]|uniref:Major facilitator superfamily (MFS) profile domain-containing protein n=1 Tax=Didymodactylos carnosus TaxID=1234261 RepID=A0A814ZWF5_9BILA|nr:unnamed protein product [Didymodactylos carnosus]CAF4016301.1 unnamed protein product [Didymodactylos carnosus]
MLAKRNGFIKSRLLCGAVLATGLLTLLTPVAARTHVAFLFTIRFLIGFASGPMFPAAGALWGKWVPPLERSTIPPAAQTGTNFGIIITTPLVSLLSSSKFLGGWPSVFYVFGAVGSSIFLVSIGFCGCNHISAVICSVFAVAFLGFHNSGCLISHLDVASNYAGEEQEWNRQSEYETEQEIIQ